MISVSKEEMEIILGIINKYAADCDVLVFGSRYKQTPKVYSDLDLAFDSGKPLNIMRIQQLKEAFEESILPYRVDVVDYRAVSDNFRGIIDRGNEWIFQKYDR
ncbi:MAG: nucleotidyltransferase domain-containing protein [Streptococcaceae bacterium]|jgi:predicted nucleotidyltransferase|nr:nucleotidyltransferase domain-containing protein [Streptococcaceae bacterium]